MTDAEKKYAEYVERYSRKHHILPEEAEKHLMVKEIKKMYEKEGDN